MQVTSLYQQTLEQIRDEGAADGGDASSVIDIDQIPLFTILAQEDVIALRAITPSDAVEGRVRSSEPAIYFQVVYGEVDRENIEHRLEQLRRLAGDHPDFLDAADGRTVITSRGDGFVAYGNMLITYQGDVLDLTYQQASLLAAFLRNYRNFVDTDRVLEAWQYDGRADETVAERSKAASKIITPLRAILTNLVGFDPISRHGERGWMLDCTTGPR